MKFRFVFSFDKSPNFQSGEYFLFSCKMSTGESFTSVAAACTGNSSLNSCVLFFSLIRIKRVRYVFLSGQYTRMYMICLLMFHTNRICYLPLIDFCRSSLNLSLPERQLEPPRVNFFGTLSLEKLRFLVHSETK